jgi:cellobiose-specific phosphotransferase system component IIC
MRTGCPCWLVLYSAAALGVVGGIRLALTGSMSPIARAIHDRFEEICRAELVRLRRKTASLSPADQAALDAISIAIAGAIAARLGKALEEETAPEIGDIVARLFAVAPAPRAIRMAASAPVV